MLLHILIFQSFPAYHILPCILANHDRDTAFTFIQVVDNVVAYFFSESYAGSCSDPSIYSQADAMKKAVAIARYIVYFKLVVPNTNCTAG
jgi:hypothetical protein